MKFVKAHRLLPAVVFFGLAGLSQAQAQDSPGASKTPMPSIISEIKALQEEKQSLDLRLKALESRAPQLAAASSQGVQEGDAGPGLRDVVVPLELGNEYFNDESRWVEFSNFSGSALFRFSGFVGAQFNFYPGSPGASLLGGLPSGGVREDFNGFLTSAKVDFGAEFDRVVGLSIGLQNENVSTGGSQFSVPVSIGISDAFLYLKLDPAFVLTAGKFTNILSLEALQTPSNQLFAAPSMVSNLVPGMDLGIMLSGGVDKVFDYAIEFADGEQDHETFYTGAVADKPGQPPADLTARVFAEPFRDSDNGNLKGLGFGFAAAWDNETKGSSNGVTTSPDNKPWPNNQTSLGQNEFLIYNSYSGVIAQGDFYHWDPQFYYYNGSFGAQGEFVQSIQTVGFGGSKPSVELVNSAWLLEASWAFGGTTSFEGVHVGKPFNLERGQWGALEVAARVHSFYADPNSFVTGASFDNGSTSLAEGPQEAFAYGFGANWWLNDHFKTQLDWEETDFSGGNLVLNPEQVFSIRAALLI